MYRPKYFEETLMRWLGSYASGKSGLIEHAYLVFRWSQTLDQGISLTHE